MHANLCNVYKPIFGNNRFSVHLGKNVYKFSFRKNFYTYTKNGIKRLTNENLDKFTNQTDDQSLFQNAHHIVKELLSDEEITLNSFTSKRNKQALDYINLGGRLRRFNICLNTYRNLSSDDMLSNENILRASVMSYLTDMSTSLFIVMDDIFDRADLRRNKPPWYKVVGMQAIMDISLLHSGMFIVMKHFFKKEPYYASCVELFNEAAWVITSGGMLENCLATEIFNNYKNHFNMETYRQLSFCKMTWNAFHLPVIAAMYMANYDFSSFSKELFEILNKMGHYSLIHNDYCDRYGKTTGKVLDEDIKSGKLTWLLLTAMERANDAQKDIIFKNYGKEDADSVKAVVNIYDELKLDEICIFHEKQLFHGISEDIETLPDVRVQNILMYNNRLIKDWYNDK